LFELNLRVLTPTGLRDAAYYDEDTGVPRFAGPEQWIVHVTYPTGHFLGAQPMPEDASADQALAELIAVRDALDGLDELLVEVAGVAVEGIDAAVVARTTRRRCWWPGMSWRAGSSWPSGSPCSFRLTISTAPRGLWWRWPRPGPAAPNSLC
jgi:hypothetical protein